MRIGIEIIILQLNLLSLINFIFFDKNDKFLWKKDKCYVKCYCNFLEIFDVRNDINLQEF